MSAPPAVAPTPAIVARPKETEGGLYQLSDFLEDHLSIYEPNFMGKLSTHREFVEMASGLDEPRPAPGEFYNHQRFDQRYSRLVTRHFQFSDTGTGKTCDEVGSIRYALSQPTLYQQAAQQVVSSLEEPDYKVAGINHALILVSGDPQMEDFYQQLVCVCTRNQYDITPNDVINQARPELSIRLLVRNKVSRAGYVVTSYGAFYSGVLRRYGRPPNRSKYPNDSAYHQAITEYYLRIAANYEDYYIWGDEFHNLIPSTITIRGIREDEDYQDMQRKTAMYEFYQQFFSHLERARIVLSSATAIVNDPSEINYVANLLLPRNGLVPPAMNPYKLTPADFRVWFPDLDYEAAQAMSITELNPYFVGKLDPQLSYEDLSPSSEASRQLGTRLRGMITYVRYADRTAPRIYVLNDLGRLLLERTATETAIPASDNIYAGLMSPFQSRVFWRTVLERPSDVYASFRAVSNFVFPDGHFSTGTTAEVRAYRRLLRRRANGKELTPEQEAELQELGVIVRDKPPAGFSRYIEEDSRSALGYRATDEFKAYLADHDNIYRSSIKAWMLCEHIANSRGKGYVPNDYIQVGMVPLALSLEAYGYKPYDASHSAFVSKDDQPPRTYCADNQTDLVIRPSLTRARRYAVINRDTKGGQVANILQLFNSAENVWGDYIQVLFVSRGGREGLNIKDVMFMIRPEPGWNSASDSQSTGRIFRTGGRENIIRELKQEAAARGEEWRDEMAAIEIYQYAAVPDQDLSHYSEEDIDYITQGGTRAELEELLSFGYQPPSLGRTPRNQRIDLMSANYYGVDFYRMRFTIDKTRAIAQVNRRLKQMAVGCLLHRERNILGPEHNYQPECDYQLCDYPCLGQRILDADGQPVITDQTYTLRYNNHAITVTAWRIAGLFQYNNSYSLTELVELLNQPLVTVVPALYELISIQIIIRNGLGQDGYLVERGDIYAWVPLTGLKEQNELRLTVSRTLQDTQRLTARRAAFPVIRRLQLRDSPTSLTQGSDTLWAYLIEELQDLTLDAQIVVYEHFAREALLGEDSLVAQLVVKLYQYSTHVVPVIDDVVRTSRNRRLEAADVNNQNKLGEDALEEAIVDLGALNYLGEPRVLIHTLDSHHRGQSKFSAVSRVLNAGGIIRILDAREGYVWRDLTVREVTAYRRMLMASIRVKIEAMTINRHYLLRSFDQTFYFYGPSIFPEGQYAKGRMCRANNVYDVLDAAWAMRVKNSVASNLDRRGCIQHLIDYTYIEPDDPRLQRATVEVLNYYVSWIRVAVPKPDVTPPEICSAVGNAAVTQNLVIDFAVVPNHHR